MGVLRLVGSLKVSVVLLAVVFVAVLAGTAVQATAGMAAAQTEVFGRLPWVLGLWGINLIAGAWIHLERRWTNLGLWALHLTLAAFCLASLGFGLTQDDLVVGVVPGRSTDRAFVRGGDGRSIPLPFVLTVVSFRVETYPGSDQPSDYVSHVEVGQPPLSAEIRMNQPLRYEGWTVYQSSVEAVDGVVSPVYKVVRSPWSGTPYALTALLFLSFATHGSLRLVARRPGGRRG